MALKQVELVRRRIANGIGNELIRIRAWLSSVDGNTEAVQTLHDKSGQELLAVLVENVLSHLGHDTVLSAGAESRDRASQARKAARGEL